MSEDFIKVNNLGDSHGDSSLFSMHPSEAPSFNSFHTNRSSSFVGVSTTQYQNKKGLFSPFAMIIALSFASIFVLFAVLRSKTMAYNSGHSGPRLIMNSYRWLQEDFWSFDLRAGGIFGLGSIHPTELLFCSKNMEHYVPCYNVSLARKEGLGNDDDILHDRHCDLSGSSQHCLVRPPKNYHVPPRWPRSKKTVYAGNMKTLHDDLKEAKVERISLGEDNMLTFIISQDVNGAEAHFQKIARILGISDDNSFSRLGIKKVLNIGCSYGSYLAYLLSRNFTSLCVSPYQEENNQVQLTLDRGLPAMIASPLTKQFPFPAASFNMIHCADCGIDWSQKNGLLLFEIDRLLSLEGYFVWMMSSKYIVTEQMLQSIDAAAKSMCWTSISNKDRAIVWRKTANVVCRQQSATTLVDCDRNDEGGTTAYKSLGRCRTVSKGIQQKLYLPSTLPGFLPEELLDNSVAWRRMLKSYWSSITPLLFSDHPKRPGEDDPLPPFNTFRNVMDMNALFGGFNAALLEAGKSVWVMNVVPTSGPNTLPMIYDRGYIGTLHNWCEAFPSYPRTYDLLHAVGLLSQQAKFGRGCRVSHLLLEMDRLLRPEGWVLIRDRADLILEARLAAYQMRWEGRIIEVEGDDNLRLLICQKVFWKR